MRVETAYFNGKVSKLLVSYLFFPRKQAIIMRFITAYYNLVWMLYFISNWRFTL